MPPETTKPSPSAAPTLTILFALSAGHFINDLIQSLLPAIYPIMQKSLSLSYAQIGLITFVFQMTASILQPFVGLYTDKKPLPYSLAPGMACSLFGLLLLARADHFLPVLVAAAIIGLGSSIFHPEASRVTRLAAGTRFGLAQSIFQVGGNAGSAVGPLLAALIIVPLGQYAIGWFAIPALIGIVLLFLVGRWYARHLKVRDHFAPQPPPLGKGQKRGILVLLAIVFSKNFYMAAMGSFYTFFLIQRFGVSIAQSQIYLFIYMAAVAIGIMFGGPLGDRFGRRHVLWWSIVGVLPFTLLLPYAGFELTIVLSIIIGLLMSFSSSALIVEAQDLAPGRVGMIGGLFFGFAFGAGGIGAALLGVLADRTSLDFVFHLCSFLPAIGVLLAFMPKTLEAAPS